MSAENVRKEIFVIVPVKPTQKTLIVSIPGIQGAKGDPGDGVKLMVPDPREYFLSLLGGEVPDIPDEPVIPDEPDYTLPILGSAKLNTMVLA